MTSTLAPTPPHPADDPTVSVPAPDPEVGPGLRDQVAAAGRAVKQVLAGAADQVDGSRGTVAALVELLEVLDTVQAAAVELAGRVETDQLAERQAGLSLEGLLALQSRLTGTDRRTLLRVADTLAGMPALRAAWHAGVVGFATVRAVVGEVSRLSAAQRDQVDAAFADRERLGRMDADQVVDAARGLVDRLTPTQAERDRVRQIEHRFLHLQPCLDGALTLYGELDAEAGATVLAALDAAAGPPTPDRDVTVNATDGPGEDDLDDDGTPRPRTRARQRADALTCLAEAFLAGRRADGTVTRPKPRLLVWADLATLAGDDHSGPQARLLWDLHGGPVRLTPAAVRRLAEDATWQVVLHDDGQVLGVTAPTPTIPTRVRAAVTARDQGCRFPGCAVPIGWCDLHHVRPRQDGGSTTVDNLVALCRRHHTAVTEGRWRLTMTDGGVVTVRRGRTTATSDPPHRRTLRPRDPDRSTAHPDGRPPGADPPPPDPRRPPPRPDG